MRLRRSLARLWRVRRAALKLWRFVAKCTTKPLLRQGVDGDLALAMNARRDFNPVPEKEEEKTHIAFEDKCKLLEPEQAMLCTPSAPRIQVVALANWERATTFVLDDHLQTNFPNVSADRLLNKCNPFLSGKRRVQKDDGDIGSEAPTTSTACSTLSENDGEEHELNMVEKEEHAVHTPPKSPKQTREGAGKPVSVPGSNQDQKKAQDTTSNNWVVNSGRPVDSEQAQRTAKAPVSSTVRWVQVGHGRYSKYLVHGESREEAIAA